MKKNNFNAMKQPFKEFMIFGTQDKVFADEMFEDILSSGSSAYVAATVEHSDVYRHCNIATHLSPERASDMFKDNQYFFGESLSENNNGNNLNTIVFGDGAVRYIIARTQNTVQMFGVARAMVRRDYNSGILDFYKHALQLLNDSVDPIVVEPDEKFSFIKDAPKDKFKFIIDVKKSKKHPGLFEVNARTVNVSARITLTFYIPVESEYNSQTFLNAEDEYNVRKNILVSVDCILNNNGAEKHLDKTRLEIYQSTPVWAIDPLNSIETRTNVWNPLVENKKYKDLFMIAKAVEDNLDYFKRFLAVMPPENSWLPVDKNNNPEVFLSPLYTSSLNVKYITQPNNNSNTELAAVIFNSFIEHNHKSVSIELATRLATLVSITFNVMLESARKELIISYDSISSAGTINVIKRLLLNEMPSHRIVETIVKSIKQISIAKDNYDSGAKSIIEKFVKQSLVNVKDALSANLFIENKTVYQGPEKRGDKLSLLSAINNVVFDAEKLEFNSINGDNSRRDSIHLSKSIIYALNKAINICKSKFLVDYKLTIIEYVEKEEAILNSYMEDLLREPVMDDNCAVAEAQDTKETSDDKK